MLAHPMHMSDEFDEQEVLELDGDDMRQVLAHAVPDSLLSGDSEAQMDLSLWLEEIEQQFVPSSEAEAQEITALLAACIAVLRGQSYDANTLHPDDLAELQQWQALADMPVPAAVVAAWQASDPAMLSQILEDLSELEVMRSQAWLNQQLDNLDDALRHAWLAKKALMEADTVTSLLKNNLHTDDPDKREKFAQYFEQSVEPMSQDSSANNPFADFAAYVNAVAALLRKQAVPDVPQAYQAHFAQVREILAALR